MAWLVTYSRIIRFSTRTILIAEPVLRPDATSAILAMHCINEAIALGQFSLWASVVGIAEQSRWHAWPESEDHECKKVTDGHGTSARFIEVRARRGSTRRRLPSRLRTITTAVLDKSIARDGVVVQPDQERYGARDVDERVQPVDVRHETRIRHEELLDGDFPEDVQSLFQLDQLDGVSACDVYCALHQSDCCECTAELIHL